MKNSNYKRILATLALLLVAFSTTGCAIFELPVQAGAPVEPTKAVEPDIQPFIQLFPEIVIPGNDVVVVGEGWQADEMILVSLDDPTDGEGPQGIYASVITSEDGDFVTLFTYPQIKRWSGLNEVLVIAQNRELTDAASAVLRIATYVEDIPPVPPPVGPPDAPVEPTEPSPTEPEPVPVPPAPLEASVLASALNVRTGPGTNYGVIKAIPQGTSVTVLAQNIFGTWLKVQLPDDTIGWVSKTYTDFDGTAPVESGPAAPIPPTPIPTPVPPGPQPPVPVITEWRGDYFNNMALNGSPVLIRNDFDVNFSWDGAPAAGLPADNFSVRWTRILYFDQGLHRFHGWVDDGMRLYIDNVLVIDAWYDSGVHEVIGERTLWAGYHSVRIEYYEHTGAAAIRVWWERITDPSDTSFPDWKAEYFDNRKLDGDPIVKLNETDIDHNWGTGSPGYGLPADNFSVRWTDHRKFKSGHYEMKVKVDDGVRVWIDGDRIIDSWKEGSRTIHQDFEIYDTDHYDIKVEYYERWGAAEIEVSWERKGSVEHAPEARFSGPYWVNEGTTATYDGSPSYDTDGYVERYQWDFDYRDNTFTVDAEGRIVSLYFPDGPSMRRIALRVTDDDVLHDTYWSDIAVENVAPRVEVNGPYAGKVGQLISLVGSATDPSPYDQGSLNYHWEFGDGTQASGASVSHAYAQPGSYTARLTVTDKDGAQGLATTVVQVSAPVNQSPTAVIQGPTKAHVGERLNFGAGASSDPDGHLTSYAWDFGDGASANGLNVTHAYGENGHFNVVLTVIDNGGASDTTMYTIVIEPQPPVNQAPVARINGPSSVKVGETAIFDSGGSYDPDGRIENYIWDFGDGPTVRRSAAESTVAHVYNAPGTYRVTLTVVDNGGLRATASHNIRVEASPPANQAPVARINGPSSVKVGETAIFDSGGSYDPDGRIENYIWDFGDGPTVRRSAAESTVAHVYNTAGTYRVTLTVVDNGGLRATASHNIRVEPQPTPNQSPRAVIQGPTKVMVGETLSFNGASSSDPEGNIAGYAWKFGDGSTANGVNVSHRYSKPGIYSVVLTVTDGEGQSDSTTCSVIVVEPIMHNPDVIIEPQPNPELKPH